MPRRAGGQQHLLRAHGAAVGVHAVRLPAAQALEPLHAGGGVDLRAAALGRLRQAAGEAAHVHLAAALVEQAADEALARHLGAHARRVQDLHVGVDAVGHQPLGAARQRFQVRRLCGQLELAAAREVAVDGLVAHDAFHRVDRGVVGVVPGTRTLHADLGRDLGVVDREPVVDVPAVAARGLGRHAFAGLQHRHAGAALGQGQRRRQAR